VSRTTQQMLLWAKEEGRRREKKTGQTYRERRFNRNKFLTHFFQLLNATSSDGPTQTLLVVASQVLLIRKKTPPHERRGISSWFKKKRVQCYACAQTQHAYRLVGRFVSHT